MLQKPEIGSPCNGCGLCCKTQACSAGSYALGLVQNYGDRAAGPCPALEQDGEGFSCGLLKRPKHYLPKNSRGVTVLRNALSILIGSGIGCDDIGDDSSEESAEKLALLKAKFMSRYSIDDLNKAVRTVFLDQK